MIGSLNAIGTALLLLSVFGGVVGGGAVAVAERPRHLLWIVPSVFVLAVVGAGMAGYTP